MKKPIEHKKISRILLMVLLIIFVIQMIGLIFLLMMPYIVKAAEDDRVACCQCDICWKMNAADCLQAGGKILEDCFYCWNADSCAEQGGEWDDAQCKCLAPAPKIKLQVPLGKFGETEQQIDISKYIAALYSYLIAIVGILAVAMIVFGGLRWLMAGGNASQIGEAKEYIGSAIIGLLLALFSYVLLQTVNPNLVSLNWNRPELVKKEGLGGEWCTNEKVFRCGNSYDCSASGQPCGPNVKEGSCWGQYCSGGTGCLKVSLEELPDGAEATKKTEAADQGGVARVCLDKSNCKPKCEDYGNTDNGTYQLYADTAASMNQYYCGLDYCYEQGITATLCKRVYGKGCYPKAMPGESCKSDDDCAYGKCNLGTIPNECSPKGGAKVGTSCDKDSDCGAGMFCRKKGELIDKCTMLGQLEDGQWCNEARECKGGICQTNGVNSCSSGNVGQPCANNSECKSGICETNGLNRCSTGTTGADCANDSECASGYKCNTSGSNHCEPI